MKMKKIAALALAMTVGMTTFTGCSLIGLNADETVATMADNKTVRLGVANFMARYTQASYDAVYVSYFGEEYWAQDMMGDGTTMETATKNDLMDMLKTYYALDAHAADYKVSLTKAENKKIEQAAEAFIEANAEDVLKEMTAEKEDVVEYLRLLTVQYKMQQAIEADADTKVSKKESAQRTITYLEVSRTTKTDESGAAVEYTDEEKAAMKKAVKALAKVEASELEAKAEEAGYSTQSLSYGSAEDTDAELNTKVLEAADALEEGEMSKIIVADDNYYIVRLDSAYDKEASQEKKQEIIENRKSELYQSVVDKYLEDFQFDVNDNVWKKVTFDELFTMKADETDTESE